MLCEQTAMLVNSSIAARMCVCAYVRLWMAGWAWAWARAWLCRITLRALVYIVSSKHVRLDKFSLCCCMCALCHSSLFEIPEKNIVRRINNDMTKMRASTNRLLSQCYSLKIHHLCPRIRGPSIQLWGRQRQWDWEQEQRATHTRSVGIFYAIIIRSHSQNGLYGEAHS